MRAILQIKNDSVKRIRHLGCGLIFHKILKSPVAAAMATTAATAAAVAAVATAAAVAAMAAVAAVAAAAPQAEPASTMAREMGVRAQFPVRLVVLR